MPHTPISSVGQTDHKGWVVAASNSAQQNDRTHIQTDPEASRMVLRNNATGQSYTTEAVVNEGSYTLVREHL